MSDQFQFQLPQQEVLLAVEEYVNRNVFKAPMHLTEMSIAAGEKGFEFTGETLTKEPRTPKPKKEPKPSKRGLAKPVLEQQAGNGSMEQEA